MSDDARRDLLGASFREGGEAYAAYRPAYPREAVARGVGETPCDVLDVGAGTGKLTTALTGLGHRVTAVDPSEDMLAQLVRSCPRAEARVGSGESTGADDSSVDAVTYGQAWHWVEPGAGSREAARVLRPGGRLVLFWNFMDLDVPWVASLNEVMHSMDPDRGPRASSAALVSGELFVEAEHVRVPWSMPSTRQGLVEQVRTRSYYLAMDPAGRDELAGRVTREVRRVFGSVDETPVEVPHVAEVYRFDLR